jgi:crotonobetainyl-CoA:carnitine CoA-transferase CaiB-like acyl-CoA transferase
MINAAEGGVLRLMQANRSPLGALPSYRLYQCGDGDWLFLACGNSTFFNKMAMAIGRPEMVSDERFQNAPWGIVDADARAALAEMISEVRRCGQQTTGSGSSKRTMFRQHLSAGDVTLSTTPRLWRT